MACRISLNKTWLCVLCVYSLVSAVTCDRFTFDLTVSYFSDVSMICDHTDLTISQQSDVRSLAWILPDGTLIDSTRRPDPKLFQLSGPSSRLDAYNLTAMDISDAAFGYYTCIVVYDSQTKPVNVIRWALNVDGADFSELMQTYQENAIVGGIAAAAVLAALGAVYLLCHFRYSNRRRGSETKLGERLNDGVQELPGSGFHNKTFISEDGIPEVRLESEAGGNSIRVKL